MEAAAPAAPDVTYASLGDRALGALLDLLALFAAFWAAGSWIAPRFGGATPTGFSLTGLPALLVMTVSLLAWLAYCLCFEWWFGATPGKWVVGAKVGRVVDAGRPGFSAALVRNVARIVDGIGVYLVGAIVMLLTKRRQRLGDLMAGTVVVRREFHPLARVAALLLVLALPAAAVVGSLFLRTTPVSGGVTASEVGQQAASTSTSSAAGGAGSSARGEAAGGAAAGGSVTTFREGPLTVSRVRLAAGKDGPERSNSTFKSGEQVAMLFDLAGLETEASAGHTKLTLRALDPFGLSIVPPLEHEDRPAATSQAVPSWVQLTLPDYCLPGQHRLEMVVEDLIGHRRLTAAVPFVVDAAPYEPSDTLVLRALRLTDGEDGPPAAQAAYPRGGTVWMAFQIVGFKPGADGAVKVQLDLSVTSASGEHVGDVRLLSIDDRFFYVPRRIPGTAHITLGELPAGSYVATLKTSDAIGGQHIEQAVTFTIAK
jgi:uncharacterized RDD family membrane protein YckC